MCSSCQLRYPTLAQSVVYCPQMLTLFSLCVNTKLPTKPPSNLPRLTWAYLVSPHRPWQRMKLSERQWHRQNRHLRGNPPADYPKDSPSNGLLQTGSENPAIPPLCVNVPCLNTMRGKATNCIAQGRGMIRRSCLAKPLRVKAPDIEIGNPASRKPFAV